MRLIDAHDLMERLYDANPKGRVELAELIETEPTVDAVEVVRCKNCAYWDATEKVCVDMMTADENGFCSWGERREDGKTDLRKGIDEAN